MISLKISPHGMKEKNLQGLLLSFITAVGEVSKGSKKSSFLNQFYRERLNSLERRELLRILNELINQLSDKDKVRVLGESSSPGAIPKEFQRIFSFLSQKRKERSFDHD